MTRRPYAGPDRTEARLNAMSITELRTMFERANLATPALYVATIGALRGAARTYLRIGRLTEAQVLSMEGMPK